MIKMKLNLLLAQRGLKQNDISDKLNIPKNTVSKYVNNTFSMINKDHLEALCKYFKCQVEDILEYRDGEYNLKLGSGLESTAQETPIIYKEVCGNKTQKQLFYEYIDNNFGQLTTEDIRKYALFLCEDDTTVTYENAVNMIKKINNQYKAK